MTWFCASTCFLCIYIHLISYIPSKNTTSVYILYYTWKWCLNFQLYSLVQMCWSVLVEVLCGSLIMQGLVYWVLVWHKTHENWKVQNLQHNTEEQVKGGDVFLKSGAEGFWRMGGITVILSPLSSLHLAASRQPGRWGALLLSDPLFCTAVY